MVDLSALKDEVVKVSRRRVEKANSRMTDDLKNTGPKNTGELVRKTGVEIVSATKTRITSAAVIDVTYGEWVVQGTPPHVIRARRGRALRFHWPKAGGVVFFAKVNHPGTTANPFFDRVVGRWADYLRRAQ